MEWMKSIATPEALVGTAGVYGLYAKTEDGAKLYLNLSLTPTLGRKEGQNYNAVGLMVRLLITKKDPVAPEGYELRDTRAYRLNHKDGEEVWAQQMNKMLWPVATANTGAANLNALIWKHLQALANLLAPLLEANGMSPLFSLNSIFEAQNPQLSFPEIYFDPPTAMMSWEATVEAIKGDVKKGYVPKFQGDKGPDHGV